MHLICAIFHEIQVRASIYLICQTASNLRECIFHNFDILANIGNFDRPFFGHNHYILSLSDLCLDIGKKIFKGKTWIQWRYDYLLYFYDMIWYGIRMLWYGIRMLWYAMSMLCYEIFKNDIIWYAIVWYGMLYYAMIFD